MASSIARVIALVLPTIAMPDQTRWRVTLASKWLRAARISADPRRSSFCNSANPVCMASRKSATSSQIARGGSVVDNCDGLWRDVWRTVRRVTGFDQAFRITGESCYWAGRRSVLHPVKLGIW